MVKDLAEILSEYELQRETYRNFTTSGDSRNKDTLLEFQARFTDIKADLRYYHSKLTRNWTRFDDKSATAIKFRLAIAISQGEYKDKEGKPIFDACSINQAEKFASGSDKYKEFVDKRAFHKESLVNISDLRDDISSYLMEIQQRLKLQ